MKKIPPYTYPDLEFYGYPVHPKAIESVKFSFFWDVCDENAPFGSDEGYEAFQYYWEWEDRHKDSSLIDCLLGILSKNFSKRDAQKMVDLCFVPYQDFVS